MTTKFCVLSEPSSSDSRYLIECNSPNLDFRRGVSKTESLLTHPCYLVTPFAYEILKRDGILELSVDEYCKHFNL